jgi:predicted amidophosphoribosyltransferase
MAVMVAILWRELRALISAPRCPSCGGPAAERPEGLPVALCGPCLGRLQLPCGGVQGDQPLLWCALAAYAGPLRQLLLRQRPTPQPALVAALAAELHRCCASAVAGCQLVPIPSWKRAANPLPALLAGALVQASGGGTRLAPQLLRRRRVTVGQHHLNRRQRLANQQGSFAAALAPAAPALRPSSNGAPLWLVDDILTTGATALAAANALQQAGWAVEGLICLGRTPGAATPVI